MENQARNIGDWEGVLSYTAAESRMTSGLKVVQVKMNLA
jgi:hypothetical protein